MTAAKAQKATESAVSEAKPVDARTAQLAALRARDAENATIDADFAARLNAAALAVESARELFDAAVEQLDRDAAQDLADNLRDLEDARLLLEIARAEHGAEQVRFNAETLNLEAQIAAARAATASSALRAAEAEDRAARTESERVSMMLSGIEAQSWRAINEAERLRGNYRREHERRVESLRAARF